MATVFSTHALHPTAAALLEGRCAFQVASALDATTLERESLSADMVIVRAPLPTSMFTPDRPLRAAIRHGAGLDMIPVDAATKAGILVANVPAVNAISVAEHVFMVMLALLRRFRMVDRDLRATGWNAGRDHATATHDLSGRTLGIVGMGHVGMAVARIGQAGFGLSVLAATQRRDLPSGIQAVPLDAMLPQVDVLVLCCPLTPETRGLIDARRVGLLKSGALLVNVARGPVVDDEALLAALRAGRLGGAALDVFATQPLPADHPYLALDSVIVTPHMAGVTEESMERMGVGAAREVLRLLAGKLPENLRNPDALDLYARRFQHGDGAF